MNIVLSITLGEILQTLAIISGGIIAMAVLKSNVGMLKVDVAGMQAEIKKMNDLIRELAGTSKRLDNVESDIRELRRGDGLILPHTGKS